MRLFGHGGDKSWVRTFRPGGVSMVNDRATYLAGLLVTENTGDGMIQLPYAGFYQH